MGKGIAFNNLPLGICLQNKGMNDCSRWPDRYPSPCCWMSCSEPCGAACWKANRKYGEECEYFKKGDFT